MRMSIILPAHNGAATLGRSLDSILMQSFGDYEAVIVNDGSTDETAAIAAEYVRRDPRFRLVSTPCRGAGAARNTGFAHARGEYILFMDADDYWLREDLLQELDSRIRRLPADVYMYQMVKVTEEGTVLERYTKPPFSAADRVLALEDVYQDLVKDGQTLAAAWNKCVRRELLESGIRFREDVLCEDIDWVLQLFSQVQTICLMNLRAYAYTQHKATSRSTRKDAPNDLAVIIADWAQRVRDGDAVHREAVAGVLAFEYGICMGSFHLLCPENRELLRRNISLLDSSLDRKTLLIRRFCGLFGFRLTCLAIRVYLLLRRIW